MPFVSITRLRLRAARYLPAFVWHTATSMRQLRRAPGFLDGTIAADVGRRTFWTATVWRDLAAMRAYRNTGSHMKAMPHLLHWCDEASVAHWEQADVAVPGADDMLARMTREGRLSKVRHPSAAHAAGAAAGDGRAPVARGVPMRPVA